MQTQLAAALVLIASCQPREASDLTSASFLASTHQPRLLSEAEILAAAQSGLDPDETVGALNVYTAHGLQQTVVQVVVAGKSRGFVVDEGGAIQPTHEFWQRERAALRARFGAMSPALFAQQQSLAAHDLIAVDIIVRVDTHDAVLPFDGTDTPVALEQYEQWFSSNAQAQTLRNTQAK